MSPITEFLRVGLEACSRLTDLSRKEGASPRTSAALTHRVSAMRSGAAMPGLTGPSCGRDRRRGATDWAPAAGRPAFTGVRRRSAADRPARLPECEQLHSARISVRRASVTRGAHQHQQDAHQCDRDAHQRQQDAVCRWQFIA